MLIALLSMFFLGTGLGRPLRTLLPALLLTGLILLGVAMTFLVSRLLSATILRGVPSSFTLELPPYRRPQFGRVIVRSILDRTLFVLGRAAAVAAPAGLLIWILANVSVGDRNLLSHLSGLLDPFGRFFGMDGVILLAFILGFPANEIVVPLMIMIYQSSGVLTQPGQLQEIRQLFVANGWTTVTAGCTILFSLMHWPCSTTCLTVAKETKSFKWTVLSFIVPALAGFAVCLLFRTAAGWIAG